MSNTSTRLAGVNAQQPPSYNERCGDHVWTEGDRTSEVEALRLDFWSYEPIGRSTYQAIKGVKEQSAQAIGQVEWPK